MESYCHPAYNAELQLENQLLKLMAFHSGLIA